MSATKSRPAPKLCDAEGCCNPWTEKVSTIKPHKVHLCASCLPEYASAIRTERAKVAAHVETGVCARKSCGNPVSSVMHVRDGKYLKLCADCKPGFMSKLEQARSQQAIGGEFAGIDTNRTFDNILRRLFGRTWDKVDPVARAQSSQFFDPPTTHEVSMVSAMEKMARDFVGYATARKAGNSAGAESFSNMLDRIPDQVADMVKVSFHGSERDKDLATLANSRATGAKTRLQYHIEAGKAFADSAITPNIDATKDAYGAFVATTDEVARAIQSWAGTDIAAAAAVSRSMDNYQSQLTNYIAMLAAGKYSAGNWLQSGPKKVQIAAICAGQAISAIVPACNPCGTK